jgi:hypothetical protein
MAAFKDIDSAAAVIRGGKYPFKNLTGRDRAYLEFWGRLIEQRGGRITLQQIAASGEFPEYGGSKKPHDGGVANRLVKADLITVSRDGNILALTQSGRQLLATAGVEIETDRLIRFGEIASRPGQQEFSRDVRQAYRNRCAITDCTTPEALEAAHIRTEEGRDYNGLTNGILLRADIHALFDAGLITLTADGSRVECSVKLADETYCYLRDPPVYRPVGNAPSHENIAHHRRLCFQT